MVSAAMTHKTRACTLDPENLQPLETWLAGQVGADTLRIEKAGLLGGGAIGENWRIEVRVEGGPRAGVQKWVLRTDAPSRIAMSHNKADEYACLKTAHEAGVRVPKPICACKDANLIGAPFMVVAYVDGTARGGKIVRDPEIENHGAALAETLGRELAKIHSIRPPVKALEFLQIPENSPALVHIARMRAYLDKVSQPRPALEYALCWLEKHAPKRGDIVLVHGDFRTGNYMIHDGELTGILDWEFSHWGDPHYDLGWFCARCWRFGADRLEAGGIAPREAFFRGYNAQAKTPLDAQMMPYWEILAAARWAVVALLQGERHISGSEPSIELLLTGVMAPEMEYDALRDIVAQTSLSPRGEGRGEGDGGQITMSGAMKQAEALLAIVLSTCQDEILPGLAANKRYTLAMIANAIGIAERALTHADPGDALVTALDVESLEVLARAIRSGRISDTSHEGLGAHLLAYLQAELAITNPKLLARRG